MCLWMRLSTETTFCVFCKVHRKCNFCKHAYKSLPSCPAQVIQGRVRVKMCQVIALLSLVEWEGTLLGILMTTRKDERLPCRMLVCLLPQYNTCKKFECAFASPLNLEPVHHESILSLGTSRNHIICEASAKIGHEVASFYLEMTQDVPLSSLFF